MLGNRRIDPAMIRSFIPSSKAAAKAQCLAICGGDIDRAEKLYDFLVKDMELPDFDAVPPSVFQQIRGTAGEIAGWIKENRGEIADALELIRSIRGGTAAAKATAAGPMADLPPLNE